MRIAQTILLSIGMLGASVAHGQAKEDPRTTWGLTISDENDAFDLIGDHSDRYYTQGFRLVLQGPPLRTEIGLKKFLKQALFQRDKEDARIRLTGGLGHVIYTPDDIFAPIADPNDRPYAGWAYISAGAVGYTDTELNGLELHVGVVGPSAHGGDAQNAVHSILQAKHALGWDGQLHDELGLNLYGERRWKPDVYLGGKDNPYFDLTTHATVALGNVETSIGTGAVARLGSNLTGDWGPTRLRPGLSASDFFDTAEGSFYVFAGASARLIGRDIFLDGNTWVDSPSVDKHLIVPEATLGAVARFSFFGLFNVRAAYTWVTRAEEFDGQNGHTEFGAWTATFTTRQ
jgi:lipid A 3-O-deacylase